MKLLRALVPALLVLVLLAGPAPATAAVSIGISVGFAPPELPVYEQPPVPGPGYIWMPGYWAYGPGGYYWVPGTWVVPPSVGLYWTPPWWGWNGSAYGFHAGYWGPSVGYYGGINYGFGYFGSGYEGGRWDRGRFFYNREMNNIRDQRITNVYSEPRRRDAADNHVGFNGGVGGMPGEPNDQERAAAAARHRQPTAPQTQHFDTARTNPALLHTTNHGQPPITATNRAGRFNNAGVVTAGRGQSPQRGAQPKAGQPKGKNPG
jgi:hypothetical protein